MKNKLYTVLPVLLLITGLTASITANAQTWGYRAGYGTTTAGIDRGVAMATDPAGNVYITGSYVGEIDFGIDPLPTAIATDCYVAKFNAAGVCQWAVAFTGGATGNDAGLSIATDGSSVYVGGNFTTSLTVPPLAAVPASAEFNIDGFVASLNANTGAGIWVNTVSGSSVDNIQSLCLGNGKLYASGNFFVSANFDAIARTANGGSSSDLFVAQLNTATGAFEWVSTGGSAGSFDNGQGSSLVYVAALNELIVTGSYANATATYTTTTPASSVSLTNAGNADICVLEVNAANGAFISGVGVGGAQAEEGLSIAYDASTQDVVLGGYFASSGITFGSNPALTNGGAAGTNDAYYARYSPDDNNFLWSKAAGNTGADRVNGITSNGAGAIYIVGAFRGTLNLPTNLAPLSITNSRTNGDDIFLARINAETGNGQLLAQGQGDNLNAISNQGLAVAAGTTGNIWITGIFGSNLTLAPLPVLNPSGPLTSDVLVARYNDPGPLTAIQSQTPATCNVGCNGTATVTPSGGVAPYTYAWTPNVSTTNTATGLCPGAAASVIITDALGSTTTKNFVITPASQLASATTNNTGFVVSATNNNIYDASCNLIATLVPNGASQVSGTVAARIWFEAGVPVYPAVTGNPYVARHYEIQPVTNAATATGRVTLYFTQLEFDNFNAAPGSTANLPTGPSDAAGKANVRFSKFAGASNNPATGTPGTYTGGAELIDPVDTDIVWNATFSRWEITFNVVGFSGFFLQTSTAILPVTWVYVNGSLNAQGQPVIMWKVQEEQVASYSIEKAIENEPFMAIASITSKGNGEHDYSFREVQALAGKASYRIKQTDLNGRTTYSRILLLKSDRKGWVTLYPNPVKGPATLNVTDKELINTTAYLYDGTGRELQRIQITQSITTIHMEQYKAGVYTLKLNNGQTMRILKE